MLPTSVRRTSTPPHRPGRSETIMAEKLTHLQIALEHLQNIEVNQILIQLALSHLDDPLVGGYSKTELLLQIFLSRTNCEIEELGFALKAMGKEVKPK